MKATTIMQAAIDHAMQRRADMIKEREAQGEKSATSHYAVGWVEVPAVGQVEVDMVIAEGASTHMTPHWRKRWTLNGQRISKANLTKMLNES